MRPIRIKLTPAAQSDTVVSASASPGAGAITLAAGASSIDTGVAGRIVGLKSGGNDLGITFTIIGVDQNGLAATEAVTGANAGTAVSTKFYASVSSITHTGSVAGTLAVGTVNTTLSAAGVLIPLDFYARIAPQVSAQVTGTINYTIKETFDPILSNLNDANAVTPSAAILNTVSAFSGKTANVVNQLDVSPTGLIVIINSYSTGATLTVNVIQPLNSSNVDKGG